ncbi:MAG TPA: acyltransferase [Stellaceae bacterium]|jgi:peptidoglycan/LPS O-acetylase OafA/YrhL|nr:acyltransferase [Stellaceae bacterium]
MQPRHIRGLDTIRFIAAFWVACGHGALNPFRSLLVDQGSVGHLLNSGILFNGVAAVIVFFLISGFCIHYPWIGKERIDISKHFTRRYVRIGLPLIACHLIMYVSGGEVAGAIRGVLWSIYCELIYYSIYPILFYVAKRISFSRITLFSTIIALILIVTHWNNDYHWQFGLVGASVVGLPSWLLGCIMAERVAGRPLPTTRFIWVWRLGALSYSSAALVALFHLPFPLGFPVTLLAFSFYCLPWLLREVENFSRKPPLALLEWAGGWSYSIYLMHNAVNQISADSSFMTPRVIVGTVQLLAIFGVSYIFYLLVELPSHVLARRLGQVMARPIPEAA